MKTREEVLVHLTKVAYTHEAVTKIMGFLIGAKLKDATEELLVVYGASTFADFLDWFNNDEVDECDDCVLCGIINDIATRLEQAETPDLVAYYAEQLAFILDAFGIVEEEIDEE